MKHLLLLLFLLLSYKQSSAQKSDPTSTTTPDSSNEYFEKYMPIYILENYCNSQGFPAVRAQLLADERATNFVHLPDPSSQAVGDSILWFNYNKMYIGLEFSPRFKHLNNFIVLASTQKEIEEFGVIYAFLMDYVMDQSKKSDVKRYYSENSGMNAVLVNLKPENLGKPPFKYRAICFVMQGMNFCK
ncbi:hypothetical protein [Hymenobacter actinosclerus]|nr:hypothetical protein [Hymenobacter actinosclerus]